MHSVYRIMASQAKPTAVDRINYDEPTKKAKAKYVQNENELFNAGRRRSKHSSVG